MPDNCRRIALRVADADFKARKIARAKMLLDGFNAVVPARAAFAADAQFAAG